MSAHASDAPVADLTSAHAPPGSSPPKPTITGRGVGLAALFWVLYTVLYALLIARGEGVPLRLAIGSQTISSVILALYSVPVWWLTIREMDRLHWGWVLLVHLILAPAYAWTALESYFQFFDLVIGIDLRAELAGRYQWMLLSNATVYGIQFSVYHLVRHRQRLRQKQQQATELWARAREQELAALKAQINPHFLFNTLNSISATLKQNPDLAREMIARLSSLLRYALDSTDRDTVPLREEVDFVRRYLSLERHRFSDRLTSHVEVEAGESVLETPVPPMILQPLVENALRHGIAPSETGGTVTVRVDAETDRLRICVTDTGVGPEAADPLAAAGGTGLSNTNARLKRTYGPDAALQTAPNDPSGLRVWFSLPRDPPA